MKIPVKTLWKGRVAVRAKFIEQCKITGEMIVIIHDNRIMSIPAKDLETAKWGISEKPVADCWKNAPPDYLYYYVWKPDPIIQRSMF